MNRNRLVAFSDGVLAIIITIMVLELDLPKGYQLQDLLILLPTFLSYVLSFTYVGIYWNNHHHLMHTSCRVTGLILWANLHLLFWLSLIPFTSGWMGQNSAAPIPTALYGFVLLMAAIAYFILQRLIIRAEGERSALKIAIGRDLKGKFSILCYAAAVGIALVQPIISQALYAAIALLWLIPDRRIERVLNSDDFELSCRE